MLCTYRIGLNANPGYLRTDERRALLKWARRVVVIALKREEVAFRRKAPSALSQSMSHQDSQDPRNVGHDIPADRLVERKRLLARERFRGRHEQAARNFNARVHRRRRRRDGGQRGERERGEREGHGAQAVRGSARGAMLVMYGASVIRVLFLLGR